MDPLFYVAGFVLALLLLIFRGRRLKARRHKESVSAMGGYRRDVSRGGF